MRKRTPIGLVAATDRNFDTLWRDSDVPVVAMFSARWCVPSVSLGPEFERLAKGTSKAVFISIDADHCPKLLTRFRVSTLPHIVFGGPGGWREINATTSKELRARIERLLASRTKSKTANRGR